MSISAHRFDNEKRRRPEHHVRQAMLSPAVRSAVMTSEELERKYAK
jgi:hypothetical protein